MMALINDMKMKRIIWSAKLVVSNNTKADGLVFAEKNSVETFAFDIENLEDNLILKKTLQSTERKKHRNNLSRRLYENIIRKIYKIVFEAYSEHPSFSSTLF